MINSKLFIIFYQAAYDFVTIVINIKQYGGKAAILLDYYKHKNLLCAIYMLFYFSVSIYIYLGLVYYSVQRNKKCLK